MTARLIADRYRLEVELGQDGDLTSWLGADTLLDRPVLVRVLDADASPDRRAAFLAGVQAAAQVSHVHLSAVYAAHEDQAGDYAVQEWAGGISLADRLAAGDLIDADDVVRNGAGLAEALAALHAAGAVHGSIDATTILYPAVQPAKLDGFGRIGGPASPRDDVADLARALGRALGTDDSGAGARPGLPADAGSALAAAQSGAVDATALASGLRTVPASPARRPGHEWSWKWVAAAAGILAVAALVGGLGVALRVQPSSSPLLFPAPPAPSAQATLPPATAPEPAGATTAAEPAPPRLEAALAYDPFGTGGERDADVPLLHDGNPATSWRTERYFDPLERIKQGVGVTFDVAGAPRRMAVAASAGTAFRVGWAPAAPDDFAVWEFLAGGQTADQTTVIELPERRDGVWLLWLTDLPAQPPDGYFYADVYEVRFEG